MSNSVAPSRKLEVNERTCPGEPKALYFYESSLMRGASNMENWRELAFQTHHGVTAVSTQAFPTIRAGA